MRQVAKLNPDLQGVLDIKDYNERQSGQRTLDDEPLAALVEVLSRHRLGLKNTEPDILGRAYEYLLRKFAEGQGQSAGEFYTPKEVGDLIAELIDPREYTTIYDLACGSGGAADQVEAALREEASQREEQRADSACNASNYFVKEKPKNVLTEEGIKAIADVYGKWETREKLSRVITLEEAQKTDFKIICTVFA